MTNSKSSRARLLLDRLHLMLTARRSFGSFLLCLIAVVSCSSSLSSARSDFESSRTFGSITNGGCMYGSICLYFESICRYSGELASSQLITCSAPWLFTKATSQRLCSSSKRASTFLKSRSFAIFCRSFVSSRNFSAARSSCRLRSRHASRDRRAEEFRHAIVAQALGDLVVEPDKLVQRGHELRQLCALELRGAFTVANYQSFGRALHHHLHELSVVLDVLLRLALADRIQRRLRDVDIIRA